MKRPRVIFDCDEVTRYALGLRKLRTGETPSKAIIAALRAHFSDEFREAEQQLKKLHGSEEPKKTRRPSQS